MFVKRDLPFPIKELFGHYVLISHYATLPLPLVHGSKIEFCK